MRDVQSAGRIYDEAKAFKPSSPTKDIIYYDFKALRK